MLRSSGTVILLASVPGSKYQYSPRASAMVADGDVEEQKARDFITLRKSDPGSLRTSTDEGQ
jgi:hypothetical protein